jgi:hypothetical protein
MFQNFGSRLELLDASSVHFPARWLRISDRCMPQIVGF